DFMTPGGWQQSLSALAIRHEVVAVWITDPREGGIPDVGVVTFEDPESGEQILVDTRSAHLRARFQQAAAAQRGTIRADLLRARAAVAEMSTEAELVPQLVAFIKQREAQRSGRLARVGACASNRPGYCSGCWPSPSWSASTSRASGGAVPTRCASPTWRCSTR